MAVGVETVRQTMFAEETVRELAAQLAPDQRFVVTMLAMSRLQGIDIETIANAYSIEKQSFATRWFLEQLASKKDALAILKERNPLLPEECSKALLFAEKSGSLDSFFRAWLSQTTNDQANVVRHEETFAASMWRIIWRVLFVVSVMTFIMLFIVPEFQKMYEEFGLELPRSMQLAMYLAHLIASLFPLMFLIAMVLFIVYLVRGGIAAIRGYFERWMPGSWRRVRLSRGVKQRQQLAWKAQSVLMHDKTRLLDVPELFQQRKVSKREGEALMMSGNPETQAWLLRNASQRRHRNSQERSVAFTKVLGWSIHIILGAMTILLAIAIFSSLITIMQGLV
jgi:type II secretory pathway component PulF